MIQCMFIPEVDSSGRRWVDAPRPVDPLGLGSLSTGECLGTYAAYDEEVEWHTVRYADGSIHVTGYTLKKRPSSKTIPDTLGPIC